MTTTTNKQQGGELPQDERAAFEVSIRSRHAAVCFARHPNLPHRYASFWVDEAWNSWQAALAQRAASVPAQAGPFDEVYALELAHDCGVRFKGDIPNRLMEDALIKFAQKVLVHFTVPAAAPVQGDDVVYQVFYNRIGFIDATKEQYDRQEKSHRRALVAASVQPNSGRDAALEEALEASCYRYIRDNSELDDMVGEALVGSHENPQSLDNAIDTVQRLYPVDSAAARALAAHPANGAQAGLSDEQIELAEYFRAAFDTPIARRKLDGGEAGKICRDHFRAILAAVKKG